MGFSVSSTVATNIRYRYEQHRATVCKIHTQKKQHLAPHLQQLHIKQQFFWSKPCTGEKVYY